MDARNVRCCLCWFTCLAAVNFLVALLIAYRTLTGECEREVCHEHGTCLTNKDGYRCQCDPGFGGDQCEFNMTLAYVPPVMNPNETLHVVTYDPKSNGSAVVIQTTPSKTTDSPEVQQKSMRDPGFTSAYWTFIILYAIISTSIFLLAFLALNYFKRKLSKDFKGKEYYGIQFKPEADEDLEGQRELVAGVSG